MNEHIKTKIQIEETDENLATLYVPLLWLKDIEKHNPLLTIEDVLSLLEEKQ